jgi:hypothetical protein
LLAQTLGEVSARQVWRVLVRHRISLQRRHSWCISGTRILRPRPPIWWRFTPDQAVLLGVDEKPSIQARERAQGYLRLPHGQALKGFSHEYERHGTATLLAALIVATRQVRRVITFAGSVGSSWTS